VQYYVIKEENFSMTKDSKIDNSNININNTTTTADFTPPKNFKIVSNKPDNLSQSLKIDQKSTSPLNSKYVYTTPKLEFSKSDITETDLNLTTTTNHNNELDSSIVLNKTNNEVRKTEKLIELLNTKLEPYFDKFERDEITPEIINDVVKKELAPLRPLFISSKNVNEKVFVALSKGNNDKYMFLNHVFKTVIEESLKAVKVNPYNIRPVTTTTTKVVNHTQLSKSPTTVDDIIIKSKIVENTNSSKFSKMNHNDSPTKTSPNKKQISNNYDSNNVSKKGQKVHMVNINNDKSIHTKNNININIQPTFRKEKYEFTELPYIK